MGKRGCVLPRRDIWLQSSHVFQASSLLFINELNHVLNVHYISVTTIPHQSSWCTQGLCHVRAWAYPMSRCNGQGSHPRPAWDLLPWWHLRALGRIFPASIWQSNKETLSATDCAHSNVSKFICLAFFDIVECWFDHWRLHSQGINNWLSPERDINEGWKYVRIKHSLFLRGWIWLLNFWNTTMAVLWLSFVIHESSHCITFWFTLKRSWIN